MGSGRRLFECERNDALIIHFLILQKNCGFGLEKKLQRKVDKMEQEMPKANRLKKKTCGDQRLSPSLQRKLCWKSQ